MLCIVILFYCNPEYSLSHIGVCICIAMLDRVRLFQSFKVLAFILWYALLHICWCTIPSDIMWIYPQCLGILESTRRQTRSESCWAAVAHGWLPLMGWVSIHSIFTQHIQENEIFSSLDTVCGSPGDQHQTRESSSQQIRVTGQLGATDTPSQDIHTQVKY